MDKATIEAMRKVVDGCDDRAKAAETGNCRYVYVGDTTIATTTLRDGVEGLRKLVDQATAEQPQAPAEPDGRDVRERIIRSENIDDLVRAINGLMTPKPTTTGEPTIEECVAAINRANHRGYGDWHVELLNGNRIVRLNADEFIGLGRLLIDRERAEAAKGGA